MMWNWLASGLASEATLCCTTARPSSRRADPLRSRGSRERSRIFGTSAKFIDAVAKARPQPDPHASTSRSCEPCCRPARRSRRRASITSTASIKADVLPVVDFRRHRHRLLLRRSASPTLPVWRGEIQCRGLGHERGGVRRRRAAGPRRERASSSAPRRFRRCPSASGTIRTAASTAPPISSDFPDVWCHGDYVELTEHGGTDHPRPLGCGA